VSQATNESIILVGYSGHGFVLADILLLSGHRLEGYMDNEEKALNPYGLTWYGDENSTRAMEILRFHPFIVAIGNNKVREKVFRRLQQTAAPINAIHPASLLAQKVTVGKGIAIMAGAIVNPLAVIHDGAIINSGAVVEHECTIGPFAHIAPGAVLAGNVNVGAGSFIGAGAAVKQGISIGKGVTVGAGAVILKDVPDAVTVVGNPGRIL